MSEKQEKKDFVNPIDIDKVAENPHLLPYAHHVGSSVIKPIDRGKVKGLALTAMYEQTDVQLNQIRKQVELLATQAQAIHDRVNISQLIYKAEMGFKPNIGDTYHLYEREKDATLLLSLIGPQEWGKSIRLVFVATVKLLSDHTWDILEKSKDITIKVEEA